MMSPVKKEDVDVKYESNSVAKGVFVFKNGRKVLSRRGQEQQTKRSSSAKGKRSAKGSRAKKTTKRPVAGDDAGPDASPYMAAWDKASKVFAQLQQQTFKEVLDGVIAFAKSHSDEAGKSVGGDSSYSSSLPISTIPACALLTGVNLPDHKDLFKLLTSRLRSEVSCHVAALRTSGRGGGAALSQKALIKSTVAQLMLKGHGEEDDEDDENEDDQDASPEVKSTDMVLPVLSAWYNNQYSQNGSSRGMCKSPTKRAKLEGPETNHRPPLIVVLEDFEGFPAPVIQDFILNIAEYSSSLPFLLVFGVATTVSAIHLKLPHHVSSYLSIETFAGQKATELMAEVVEKVVMNDEIPFKLGGKCLQLLLEIFLFSDFSVKRFLSSYKYCLFEHYSRSPVVSMLCQGSRQRKVYLREGSKRSPCELNLDHCRSLPSFRRFVEEDVNGRAKLLVDDDAFVKELDSRLDELDVAAARFSRMSAALYGLTADLPGAPLGRQLYSVYRLCLVRSVGESHEYREAFDLLAHLSPANLEQKLRKFAKCLREGLQDYFIDTTVTKAEELLKRLEEFSQSLVDAAAPASNPSTPTSTRKLTESPTVNKSGKKVSRAELQKNLLEQARERRKQLSPFEGLRKEVLEFLHESLVSGLRSPTLLPFHELKFFDNTAMVRRHLMVFPRGVIKTALEDPYVYLEDKRLEIHDRQEVPTSFPDLCIAFKLHQEGGKLINLYDWMQSWLSIANSSSSNCQTSKDGEDDVDPVDQARFTQAVSSLQFLGFVKPSKRKTDHMSKLTWAE